MPPRRATRSAPAAERLARKIENRTARLAVIGLGYVGLPLAVEFAQAGFQVHGIDIDLARVRQLRRGHSYVQDVASRDVAALVRSGNLIATHDFAVLKRVDAVNVCVPTPLSKQRDPDVSYIVAAAREVASHLHRGMLVILESTTYPGTTDELILPLLQETGMKVGKDFFLAFSPERVDPGNPRFNTRNIPKVVGGVTSACTEVAVQLYRQRLERVVPVSSPQVAEMVKLLENTFRSVNIGLVNELALMCARLKIDVWEVIEAAATKPFGFMPFYPGPGLGGHCIPIDPFYLSWKARASGFEARFIELAGHVNGQMPDYVVNLVAEGLNRRGRAVRGSRVLVLGVAYKADIDDTRESPSLDIMETLRERGAKIEYSDPYVSTLDFAGRRLKSVPLTATQLRRFDCAVIATAHKAFPYGTVLRHSKVVVDSRNALRGRKSAKIVRL
ncbi:MAG: UDP-N-acetyl-D-glucosamine dehydrogenase [Candidatus Eisenbacteria bacterium RBG_16_71_46]|nr:MAG: UDP-N-acetyl-D-glucosamine dehydrogenase [Candidatus Eisenbacteria bacterium RBG_16_71_46]OGF21872.1 MAG: UDP-N-acetyl-D-glucosamine dehydrogenase [Candidatus Eisenbacteria bacterium RBG_19FT_COMBO_70_11]